MDQVMEFLSSGHSVIVFGAIVVAFFILGLILRKLISVGIVAVFVILAVILGLIVMNYDSCRSYFTSDSSEEASGHLETCKKQLMGTFEEVKEDVGIETGKYTEYLEGMKGFDTGKLPERDETVPQK